MNLIDIILLVLIVLIIYLGFRKGIATSIVSLLSFLFGVPAAAFVSSRFSLPVYDNYLSKYVKEIITEQLQKQGSVDEFAENINQSISSLPEFISNGIDTSILSQLNENNIITFTEDKMIKPIAVAVVEVVLFILVFLLFGIASFIIKAILKKHNKKNDLPLGTVNRVLGALLGCVKAVAVLVVLSAVAYIVTTNTNTHDEFVSMLEDSVIIQYINTHNPIL